MPVGESLTFAGFHHLPTYCMEPKPGGGCERSPPTLEITMNNTLTKRQIKNLNTAERIRLLKLIIDSFDSTIVTGLYSSSADFSSKNIYRGSKWNNDKPENPRGNSIIISTDICSG